MIDFGFLTPPRIESFGRRLDEITHIAISHLHADHIGGLEELAFKSRFVYKKKPTLLLPPTIRTDLWNHSLRGGLEWVSAEDGTSLRCNLECYFDPKDLSEEWTPIGTLAVKAFRTDHVPNKASWGFVVRDLDDGSTMIFGCDTRAMHAELLEQPLSEDFSSGPIFHDCRLSSRRDGTIHIHLSELSYPHEVQERVVIVHYDDDLEIHRERIAAAGLKIVSPGQTVDSHSWRTELRASDD